MNKNKTGLLVSLWYYLVYINICNHLIDYIHVHVIINVHIYAYHHSYEQVYATGPYTGKGTHAESAPHFL